MRRHLGTVLIGLITCVALAAFAQQPAPKLKDVVEHMKQFATSHGGLVSRMPQGTSYFKWIQNPPPGYEKAFFQLIELNIGKRFLSLKLVRKTPSGVELTVLSDNDLNGNIEEAYRATGRSLADADRAIQTSQDKLKTAVTPELVSKWTEGLDELKFELKAD